MTYRAPSHRYHGKISYRKMDKNEKEAVTYGVVKDLISCPGHSAPLARIRYETKEEVVLAAPNNVKVGDIVASGASAPVQTGNVLPLKNIPEGSLVYNLELKPGDGGKLVRTAGSFAKVMAKTDDGKILLRLPSKKQKIMNGECRAMLGVIAGDGKFEKPVLKAGNKMHAMRARNKLYPKTSGSAMNSVDHPFGSGRGRNPGKKNAPRFAPARRNVGLIKARKTGRGKKK